MYTTRFAPSPTGSLHLGHAFAALFAFDAADAGGRFFLRIEDLDAARSRAQFVQGIEQDLRWLGLRWPHPVLRQSERTEAYRKAIGQLTQRGVTYPCFCTRHEIQREIERAAEAPHPAAKALHATAVYPGTCRHLSDAERARRLAGSVPYALRLDVGRAAALAGTLQFVERGSGPKGERGRIAVRPELLGDIVLARKDLPAAYHLAVVLDDAYQGVTLVTRGNDLFTATHVQRLLQALLGLPEPHYAHHRLILDAQGRKFSKRDQAVGLCTLREGGLTLAALRGQLGLPSH